MLSKFCLLPLILMESSDNSIKSKWGTRIGSYIPLIILNGRAYTDNRFNSSH